MQRKLSVYVDGSRYQNAGQNNNIKKGNKSFGRVENFKYFGTTVIHQNSIFEDTFRCDIPVVFYKLNTKYNCQSKHNKNYCIMFYSYMFRPFSLDHLQVVYTRP